MSTQKVESLNLTCDRCEAVVLNASEATANSWGSLEARKVWNNEYDTMVGLHICSTCLRDVLIWAKNKEAKVVWPKVTP